MTQRPRRRIRIEMPKHGDAPERIDVELVRPDGRVVVLHDAFVVKTPSLDRDLYGVRMIDVRFAFDFYQVQEVDEEPGHKSGIPRRPRQRHQRATCMDCGARCSEPLGPTVPYICANCKARAEELRAAAQKDARGRQHHKHAGTFFEGDVWEEFMRAMNGAMGRKPRERRAPAWFELLGRPSTIDEAKAAYKAQCMEKHPDRPGGSEVAMKELNAALRAAHKHFDA